MSGRLLKQGLDWDWTELGLGLDWAIYSIVHSCESLYQEYTILYIAQSSPSPVLKVHHMANNWRCPVPVQSSPCFSNPRMSASSWFQQHEVKEASQNSCSFKFVSTFDSEWCYELKFSYMYVPARTTNDVRATSVVVQIAIRKLFLSLHSRLLPHPPMHAHSHDTQVGPHDQDATEHQQNYISC